MIKQSKMVYIMGSIVIGILAVLGIISGLIFGGVFDASNRTLVFSSASKEDIYNGESLVCEEWKLESGELKEGHTASVTVTGNQSVAGESENTFSVVILDKNGADVTEDYDIVCNPGTLTVYKRPYEIKCIDGEKDVYDGTPLTAHGYEFVSGSLVDGHAVGEVNYVSQLTDVGECENNATASIVDSNGKDVTANYELTIIPGKLKVHPRPVTVRIDGAEKDYNGEPLTNNVAPVIVDTEAEEEGIVDGETWTYSVTGSQTSAGSSKNEFTIAAYKSDGTPSTDNYEITYLKGELVVNPRKVTIITPNVSEQYTGSPIKGDPDDYEVLSNFLDPGLDNTFTNGDKITVTVTGSRTEVGESKNSVEVAIVKADGVTSARSNYEIEFQLGTITVKPINLSMVSKSTSVPYNGVAQSLNEVEEGNTLLPGHHVVKDQILFLGEKKNVGTYSNVFDPASVVILDAAGEDVSHLYNITPTYGNFSIYAIEIAVGTNSASKSYDGTPLVCNTYDDYYVTGNILPGHWVDVTITGTITYPGTAENLFIVNAVKDASNNDVTANYKIQKVFGQLVIFETTGNAPNTPPTGDISNDGDGSFNVTPVYEVLSGYSGNVYLRQASYGDYQVLSGKTTWLDAPVYGGALSVNPLHYSYESLYGATGYNINVKKLSNAVPYAVPYYSDLSAETDLSDSYINNDSLEYQLLFIPFDADDYTLGNVVHTYSAEETAYRNFVYDNYLSLPTDTETYMEQYVIPNIGVPANDPNIIQAVAEFVRTKVDYDMEYHFEGDIAVYFFKEAKTAICQHYATAATALYRALDIPARYVTGITGKVVADKKSIISTPGHAWVEVYLDGMGWMPVEVTGGSGYGGFTPGEGGEGGGNGGIMIKPYDLYLQGNMNTSITYADSPNADRLQGKDFESLCNANGYTYTFKVEGQQDGLGKSASKISSFTLFDAAGDDITDEYNFKITDGVLQVYDTEITVYTGGGEWVYDGEEHTVDSYWFDKELNSGHSVKTATLSGKITEQGNVSNTLKELVIVDSAGNNVTDHYKINRQYGVLTVKVREIVITADSAEKAYDGTVLTCSTYTIEILNPENPGDAALVTGDKITVTVSGKITGKGRTANKVISHVIKNKYGADVTANYAADYVDGTLRIY